MRLILLFFICLSAQLFSQQSFSLSYPNWKFKVLYQDIYLAIGQKYYQDIVDIEGLPYRFLRVNRGEGNDGFHMEMYANMEGVTDPMFAAAIDNLFEEWTIKFGDKVFLKGENTSIQGKRKGFIPYNFYFPKDVLSLLIKKHKLIQKFANEKDSWRWRFSNIWTGTNELRLVGTYTLKVKRNGLFIKVPVFLINQNITAKGHPERGICPKILNIERSYWVLCNTSDPLIVKAEEYFDEYFDSQNTKNPDCFYPRSKRITYRQSRIVEIYPRE